MSFAAIDAKVREKRRSDVKGMGGLRNRLLGFNWATNGGFCFYLFKGSDDVEDVGR